jgi:DNA-binding transcriptional ArsR family regulator
MDKILVKIILCMNGQLPLPASGIAKKLAKEKKINVRTCAERIKYRLDALIEAGMVESFKSGNKNLYKLAETIEILDGTIVLKDAKGTELYTEEKKLLRMMDENGEVFLSILEE